MGSLVCLLSKLNYDYIIAGTLDITTNKVVNDLIIDFTHYSSFSKIGFRIL